MKSSQFVSVSEGPNHIVVDSAEKQDAALMQLAILGAGQVTRRKKSA